MKPGTRVVSNEFDMADWQPDLSIQSERAKGYLWIVLEEEVQTGGISAVSHPVPHAGGDHHFLVRAYGKHVSFLYAWAKATVINPGSVAVLAFVFGDFMSQFIRLGPYSSAIFYRRSYASRSSSSLVFRLTVLRPWC
jgi:hypothetical protein